MNQEAPLSGKRIVYFDILKIIAAFMVCFYHLNMLDMGYYPGRFYLPNANRMIMNLGAMSVPLFFMVNGALLLRRPHSLSEIFIRFVRLCLMYVFWSIVIHGILSLIIEGRFVFHAKAFLMSGTSYTVHLWFLRTAAILTLLTPALYGLFMRKKRFLLYGMLLALLVFPFLYNYVLLAGRLLDIPAFFYLDRTGAGTLYSIVYFVLGKILSDHARSKRCTRTVSSFLLCCFLILCGWMLVTLEVTLWTNINHKVFDGVNGSFPTIGALLMAVGMFTLVSRFQPPICPRLQKIITFTGSHIIGIYLFHPLFTHLIRYAFNIYIPAILTASLTAIIMIASLFITAVLKRIPLVRQLLST